MRKITWILTLFTIASLMLVACGTKPAETEAPIAETQAPTEAGGLPDLGGKSITVAVENAYPPFNSIDETSGEGKGWDYDAVKEICKRLNCVPEFKQAAWDGIFPALQAGG